MNRKRDKTTPSMTPDIVALTRRQDDIEQRIAYIEARLGILKHDPNGAASHA